MKKDVLETLTKWAKEMPIKSTTIKGYGVVVHEGDKTVFNSNGDVKRATIQNMRYNAGAKPENNLRKLKKAYKKGGLEECLKVVKHAHELAAKR